MVITADNVVLDGLEVKSGSGDLIDSEDTIPTAGTILRHNIIHHSSGDEGVQLRSVTNAVIEYNYVYNTVGDGINLCCGSTGGTIQFNEVHDISSPDAAIYVYDLTPNTNIAVTIQCNLVYDIHNNDGIKLGSKNGGDAADTGGSILHNLVYNTVQDGITVYASGVLVDGNEVYNSTSENGAIYVAYSVSDVTIKNNYVHDNTLKTFKWGNPGGIMVGTAVNAATVQVNYNNITGNSPNGVTNKATASLNAEHNWWGAADGPSSVGPGSGDSVSTNVDFNSWLTGPQVIANLCDDEGPITSDVVAPPNPVAVGGSVTLTANVDDSTTGGSNIASAEYRLDSGAWTQMTASDSSFDSPTEDVTTSFTAPPEAGIYNLCVRGTDAALNIGAEECIFLVVYDPDGGFVTGGGWIDSPPGAYTPDNPNDTDYTGKATFGFVSKYKKGAQTPHGQTEFQFKAANLHFKSSSYEWLVVAGARAQYKGSGTINGTGDYGFMLTAIDGQISGGGGTDKFRIKIWDKANDVIVYDNQAACPDQSDTADPCTVIGGGSIVIHKK